MWHRATTENAFYCLPEILWSRNKIMDECKATTDKQASFDVPLRNERQSKNWPMTFTEGLEKRMKEWAYDSGEAKNIEIYENLYLKRMQYEIHTN